MKSRTEIDPQAYARAQLAAESLKQQLEARLINKTAHAWSCSCGACGAGPSRVVAINVPSQFPHQIGMWLLWTCVMEDDKGKRWCQGLSNYLTFAELYPLFRQAFAGIDLLVDHAYAQSYRGQPSPFGQSGRLVDVSTKQAIFVRPIGDLSQSVWVNAEIRIDSGLANYPSSEALIACNVDALEFGQQRGRGQGNYCTLHEQSGGQAFYIRLPGHGNKETFLPIARLVTANKKAGTATLELDQSVEAFEAV